MLSINKETGLTQMTKKGSEIQMQYLAALADGKRKKAIKAAQYAIDRAPEIK